MMRAIAASMVRRWKSSKNRGPVSLIVFATIASPGYRPRSPSALTDLRPVAKYEPANGRANPVGLRPVTLSVVVAIVRMAQRKRRAEDLFPLGGDVRVDYGLRHARIATPCPSGGLERRAYGRDDLLGGELTNCAVYRVAL